MTLTQFRTFYDTLLLEPLSTPVWLFDVRRYEMWWGNASARLFWSADTVQDLRARDFSSDTETTKSRVRQLVDGARGGQQIRESWTFYPKGQPKQVVASLKPVVLEHDTPGLLVEVLSEGTPMEDPYAGRILEAARTTSLMVSMVSLDGRFLVQNPAAVVCYGDDRRRAGASELHARFVDPSVADAVLAYAARDERHAWEAEVMTLEGQRTHLLAVRRGRDPVSGADVAILSEEDVTDLAALRRFQRSLNNELRAELEKNETRLQLVEERFAQAIENALIWDWDLQSNVFFVSSGVVNALHFDQQAFQTLVERYSWKALVDRAQRARMDSEIALHLSRPGHPLSTQVLLRGKGGVARWFHAQGTCKFDENGNPRRSLGLLTDITLQKELEASLMVSQRLEAIGQLTGGVAHDFNNLLTVILGNVELLEVTGQVDKDLTGEIAHAVRRGAELTSHMLSFARKQTLQPKPVDLHALLERMQNTLLRTLGEDIAIVLDGATRAGRVFADPVQIEAAILNVALNARDAMPRGGRLTISCRNQTVRHRSLALDNGAHLLDPGDYVTIAMTDTGKGMSRETLEKAFEPFFSTKEVGKGSGLGLSMVLGFSRQSGGDAQIESVPSGGGTTVTLTLPRCSLDTADAPFSEISVPVFEQAFHVHVLEDNPHVQKMLGRTLRAFGLDVTTSSRVSDALCAARRPAPPDLFLVDLILPDGQSGYDFVKAVREQMPDARIVLLSGFSDPADCGMENAAPDLPLLVKPVDAATLARTVATQLQSIAAVPKPH